MKTRKRQLPISTLCSWRDRIEEQPHFQRLPAWTRAQKQLLIDSIIRKYEIPKMYWRMLPPGQLARYKVIDGQQRLHAIWEFKNGDLALSHDLAPVSGISISGMKYRDLPLDLASDFDSYGVDVVIVEEAIQTDLEDEVREMFLRLQNGTALNAQEKRNAMSGAMRDFVKVLGQHPVFLNCAFGPGRFVFDHIAAQTTLIELCGGPTDIRDDDVNLMYERHRRFDVKGAKATKVRRTYDFLSKAFPAKTPELTRHSTITLYGLASLLIDRYVVDDLTEALQQWFIAFEAGRRADEALPEDRRDLQLVEYRRLIHGAADAGENIRARIGIVQERFLAAHPKIEALDATRRFDCEQRLDIYRRDQGVCQLRLKCEGARVPWENWHADHILPYSKGGRTTHCNGQVACSACNLAKGANVLGLAAHWRLANDCDSMPSGEPRKGVTSANASS
ncbi:DUF262 domain-containing protein [Reyranella sp.]|jgi:hypothetical protein|uniref:HNH endonuclease family protein n=1 Tax=Reyranella sp. TaxID=1929291 RepID=UPI0026C37DE4|nr:DUF262 domain-containing protein [Reyranella sp.]HQS14886.1 DUF262 domain-containing protein [Reyranella sp.]HQT14273.1 DUF262 domain-containing protein [Reyranella sp.]